MATITLGTNGTTSLVALAWNRMSAIADVAAIAANIKDDKQIAHPIWPGAFSQNGRLYIPNRGFLNMLPGDYVAYDSATGWPILLSQRAIASGPYTHS